MSSSPPWLALIALAEEQLPTATAIAEELTQRFPDCLAFTATSESDGGITFTFGDATGNVTLVDRAIPWEQLEGPCEVAWYWPAAADALRSHASHLFVTLLDGAGDPIAKATHLTQLSTAITAVAPAVGVVWGPSSMVHKPADFATVASEMSTENLPLHLWVDFRVVQLPEENSFTLFTTGLEMLGHREFEVTRFIGDPQLLASAVYNVAHYVLSEIPGKGRPVLKDGEAIGLPDEKQVNVRIEPSQYDPEQEVVRLDFE